MWLSVDILLLACLTVGLLLLLTTGFSVPISHWFFPGTVLICVLVTLIFHSRVCARYRGAVAVVLLLAYLLTVYLNQDAFLQGMREFGSLISYTAQKTYSAEALPAFPGADEKVQVFLLLLSIPGIFWLGMALFSSNLFVLADLLVFPLLALAVLCGGAKNTAALFFILFGMVLGMAFSRPKRQRRMWGGANRELWKQNRLRFESIQKKTTAAVLAACIVLSIPGFLVVRPLLSVRLKSTEQLSMQLQSRFLNRVMKLLPELSAGRWKLNLEAVGGGVQEGALGSSEGYLLEGVEDLRLTLNRKPQQTIFLKGYVGKTYENGSWDIGSGATFDGASMNWNTEGSPRVFIQNLPFLRTAYALTDSAGENPEVGEAMSTFSAEPGQLLVERINANDSYTYVPYGVFLNDYYQVHSGDGAVAGQQEQEDRFFFFSREDMEQVLSAWNALEETANVLDRVEESYRAFCQVDCCEVPEMLEGFQQEIRSVMAEKKWRAQENLEEITAWIRQYLAENYHYQLIPPELPEGADALAFFLTESKTGNSVHFASAAVMLYRMFGIPARYVVGYEVPASLFTAQVNGIYTATVQGDQSQAWAEIYVPGVGWMPKDMTPGVIGTLEEVGPGGEKIEAAVAGEDPPETETIGITPEDEMLSQDIGTEVDASEPVWDNPTVGRIVTLFLKTTLTVLAVAGLGFGGRILCRDLGLTLFHRRSRQARLLGVFQALFRRMQRLGLQQQIDSQTDAFADFCEQILRRTDTAAADAFRPALQRLYRSCFGDGKVEEKDIRQMRRILIASWKRPSK